MTTIATPENLDDLVEFDVPFRIGSHQEFDPDLTVHGPDTVEIDAATDITVSDPSWEALSGFTGQYGYRGAVMHPSEYLGAGSRPSTAGLGTLHVYRAHDWGRFRDIDVPDDPGVHAFLAYLRRGHDRRRAAVLARRYLRTWYPGSGTGLNTIRISSETGDRYIEVVAHVHDGGNVDALLQHFSLWMNGDIWSVAPPQDDPDDARLVYAPDAVTALNRHLGW